MNSTLHPWGVRRLSGYITFLNSSTNTKKRGFETVSIFQLTLGYPHKRVGPLLQGRYKAILIEKENYSLELSRYIHLNPVKAGLVKTPQEWTWSSYRIFLGEKKIKKWMERDWLLGQFSKSERHARRLFERFTLEGLNQEWNPQDRAKGFVLGGEEFTRWVKEEWLEGRKKADVTGIKEL